MKFVWSLEGRLPTDITGNIFLMLIRIQMTSLLMFVAVYPEIVSII